MAEEKERLEVRTRPDAAPTHVRAAKLLLVATVALALAAPVTAGARGKPARQQPAPPTSCDVTGGDVYEDAAWHDAAWSSDACD